MPSVLIHDCYTLDGNVPALGSMPEINFRYRPALPEQVYDYLRSPKTNGKEELKAVIELLQKHLISWDIQEQQNGQPSSVAITAESLKRVPHRVQQKMVDYVTGYSVEEQAADAKN